MRVTFVQKTFLNLKGIYLFALQKDKCQEKVWKKGVEFEEGKKDLSLKGLFPLLKYRPLSGTEQNLKGAFPFSSTDLYREQSNFYRKFIVENVAKIYLFYFLVAI